VRAWRWRSIPKVEEGPGPSALLGEAAVGFTTYSTTMNNPWLSLIAALSGQRISTPSTWPVREVHRLFDVRVTRSAEDARRARHIRIEKRWS
jgi:hypothetical protein